MDIELIYEGRTPVKLNLEDLDSMPTWITATSTKLHFVRVYQNASQFMFNTFDNIPVNRRSFDLEYTTYFGDHARFILQTILDLYFNDKIQHVVDISKEY